MINQVLLYAGSALLMFWGVAHLAVTRSVVNGFGDVSDDNKRILVMEWLIEGVCLIYIAVLVSAVTYRDCTSGISKSVYRISFVMLNVLSAISLLTGFKVDARPFKLCPVIFTTASILILLGSCSW